MAKYERSDMDSIPKMATWLNAFITSTSSNIKSLPIPTMPSSLSESISLNANEQAIVARWAPIVSYASTGSRNISLSFTVCDEYMPDGYTIVSYVNALKSLEYPTYKSNEVVSPQCRLKMANIDISGIVTSVSVSWGGKISGAISGGVFTIANISLQFKEVSNSVKGAIQIKGGA